MRPGGERRAQLYQDVSSDLSGVVSSREDEDHLHQRRPRLRGQGQLQLPGDGRSSQRWQRGARVRGGRYVERDGADTVQDGSISKFQDFDESKLGRANQQLATIECVHLGYIFWRVCRTVVVSLSLETTLSLSEKPMARVLQSGATRSGRCATARASTQPTKPRSSAAAATPTPAPSRSAGTKPSTRTD